LCEKLWWSNRSDNKSSSVLYVQHAQDLIQHLSLCISIRIAAESIYCQLPGAQHDTTAPAQLIEVSQSPLVKPNYLSIDRSIDVKCIYVSVCV
jgi:hypothetical protein